MDFELLTCPQWGARQPRHPITPAPAAVRIIFHHTAGHHAELANPANESEGEAIRYARDVQAFHMDVRGWIDSGHNFLVCRNGLVLQGRWLTVSEIEGRRMVVSAHCPGQNGQVGIEHEHLGGEPMTPAQREASAQLQAWIARQYNRSHVLPVEPHRRYFATDCPGVLVADIPAIAARAQAILAAAV